MFTLKTHKTVAGLLVGLACLSAPEARAASELKLSGSISGTVSNNLGVPQMGATVLLYTKLDRLFGKTFTDDKGSFQFPGLAPENYSLRVTLATFVPALRRDILVQPGMRSVLNVSLSTLFSTIQISYPTADNPAVMTDDWKWMLRSASVNRPVLRLLDASSTPNTTTRTAAFSDTRGILQVSAGEGALASGVGTEADLGTTFAVATSLAGNSSIKLSGNVGYGSQTGTPASAFSASYSRDMMGGSPEVSLIMRQLMLPARLGAAITGAESGLPAMRTVSAGFGDRTQLSDNVSVQYGFALDCVTFVDHLNYLSPYLRLTDAIGPNDQLDFSFTSGNARPDLASAPSSEGGDLQGDIASLGVFPRMALRDGRSTVQRGQDYEVAYTHKSGSRRFYASAYREEITNATLSMVAPAGMFPNDLLPDLFSNTSAFNAGNFASAGVNAGITQNFGDRISATVVYGNTGALIASKGDLPVGNVDELRAMIRSAQRNTLTGRIAATLPKTGAHMIASYQWTTDRRAAMPGNLYSTQDDRSMPGLNVYIRQPIPSPSVLPWRMEATADLRNLLAEGYLPIGAGAQQVILVETPRSFRGGLSFIF